MIPLGWSKKLKFLAPLVVCQTQTPLGNYSMWLAFPVSRIFVVKCARIWEGVPRLLCTFSHSQGGVNTQVLTSLSKLGIYPFQNREHHVVFKCWAKSYDDILYLRVKDCESNSVFVLFLLKYTYMDKCIMSKHFSLQTQMIFFIYFFLSQKGSDLSPHNQALGRTV